MMRILSLLSLCLLVLYFFFNKEPQSVGTQSSKFKNNKQKIVKEDKSSIANLVEEKILENKIEYFAEVGEHLFYLSLEHHDELSGKLNIRLDNFDFNLIVIGGVGVIEEEGKKIEVRLEKLSQDTVLARLAVYGNPDGAQPTSFAIELLESEAFNKMKKSNEEIAYDPAIYAQGQYELESRDQEYQEQATEIEYERQVQEQDNFAAMSSQEELDYNQALINGSHNELSWAASQTTFNFNQEENPYNGQEDYHN